MSKADMTPMCHSCVVMVWRYEFLATRFGRAGSLVIDGGEFRADSVEDAKAVLHSVARNIKVSVETRPDAVRLVDALGREVTRLPLRAGGERQALSISA